MAYVRYVQTAPEHIAYFEPKGASEAGPGSLGRRSGKTARMIDTAHVGEALHTTALGSAAIESTAQQLKVTDSRLSAGLGQNATRDIEHLLTKRSHYRKGDGLYCAGEGFKALYAICLGSCKTVLVMKDGQDQVAGYHLAGEIIGFDGIDTDTYGCQAIALEDMEVWRLPFDQLEHLARVSDSFGHTLRVWLSRENTRVRTLTIMLGTMRADQRLAMFLLDLSHRYRERGYSSCEFLLRLSRQDIGSYLGLTLETVSRLLSRFQRKGRSRWTAAPSSCSTGLGCASSLMAAPSASQERGVRYGAGIEPLRL